MPLHLKNLAVFASATIAAAAIAQTPDMDSGLVFHETFKEGAASNANSRLTASATGPGKNGGAVLLECREGNLLKDASFQSAGNSNWIWMLLNGASKNDDANGTMTLPQGGILRQVATDLKRGQLYCFSVCARAADGKSAKLSLNWGGSNEQGAKTFDAGAQWRRIWVAGRSSGGAANPTIKALSNSIEVKEPQLEHGRSAPGCFTLDERRSLNVLEWRNGGKELFDAACGSAAFWFDAEWLGQTNDLPSGLFSFDDGDGLSAKSFIRACAYTLEPNGTAWKYAIDIRVCDNAGRVRELAIPLQGVKPGWHHFAVSWSLTETGKSSVAAYLDGEEKAKAGNLPLQGMSSIRRADFGGLVSGAYLNGWLSDVRVYKRALDANEVKTIFLKTNETEN